MSGSSLRVRLELERSTFIAGEEVWPLLTVESACATPVEIEDPLDPRCGALELALRAPGANAPRRFTPASLEADALAEFGSHPSPEAPGDEAPEEAPEGWREGPEEPPPVAPAVSIAPGEARAETLPLSRMVSLERPGGYTLEATLRLAEGARATSAPLAFEVAPLSAVAGDVGLDGGVPNLRRATALALHDAGPEGGVLLRAGFVEDDPGHGTFRPPIVRVVARTAPGATDPLAPVSAHDRAASPHDWRIWREGATVRALHAAQPDETPPQSLALDDEPESLLRPALLAPSGEVDVFVLAQGASEVACLRFFPPPGIDVEEDDEPPEGPVTADAPDAIDAIPLEGTLEAFGAAIGPDEAESPRHVCLLLGTEAGLSLQRWVLAYGYEVSLEDEAPLALGLRALPASNVAVRADAEGAVEAALLCLFDEGEAAEDEDAAGATGGAHLALVRVACSAREEAGPPEVTDLGPLPAAARAAGLAFSVVPGSEERLDWLVLLEDGRAVASDDPARAFVPAAPPAVPIALAPLAYRGYFLALDPARGPRLLPLGGEAAPQGHIHGARCGCARRRVRA